MTLLFQRRIFKSKYRVLFFVLFEQNILTSLDLLAESSAPDGPDLPFGRHNDCMLPFRRLCLCLFFLLLGWHPEVRRKGGAADRAEVQAAKAVLAHAHCKRRWIFTVRWHTRVHAWVRVGGGFESCRWRRRSRGRDVEG
jgi:hypothetical protein